MRSNAQVIEDQRPGAIRALFSMTKPTISLLVVITAIPGLLLASPRLPGLTVMFACLAGTMLASMSAGVFNHLVDIGIDHQMNRTKRRPLPSGTATQAGATAFALVLGFLSFGMLWHWTTPMAAWISLAANIFYVLVYTKYLKPRTPQNIVLGGAAGCVGPLIGWAAASGTIGWPAWVLFGIIFMWTPPHFWALALKYKDDYAGAGIPMFPVVYGDEKTRLYILLYTIGLIPLVCALFIFRVAGLIYLVPAVAMTLYFAWLAARQYLEHNNSKSMSFFLYSCLYLFGIFGALSLDRLVQMFGSLG